MSKAIGFNIDETTSVPLWSVFLALPIFVGFVSWICFVAYTTASNTVQITEIKIDNREMFNQILTQNKSIIDRLSRIEENLKYVQRNR